MDRSALLKYAVIGLAVFLFIQFGLPKLTGKGELQRQPIPPERSAQLPAAQRAPEQKCEIKGNRFTAVMSTRGATLWHEYPEGAKYTIDGKPSSPPMDLVTTPDHEDRRPLRFALRANGAENQLDLDLFDWTIAASDATSCTFTYDDAKVALKKVVRATAQPFELETELTVTNKQDQPATHRAAVETAAWRYDKDIQGGLGRQSPFTTQVECLVNGKLVEKTGSDFEPSDFSDPTFHEGWLRQTGDVGFAATTNFYFAQALVPTGGPGAPACDLQIEDRFSAGFASKKDDKENGGSYYRARLAWPDKTLAKGESQTYKVVHFDGPKEREVLSAAAAGKADLGKLIHLGTFWFIARILVGFLIKVQGVVGSWGLSIIILTVTVRMLLFPLTWRQIKSGAKMQQMKPELDELNRRYADDPQQKQLATMELWKKHDVNPVAGCLPVLAQMPVWFALYTSLQTAAELYHTPFLWFRDLSAPDTFHFMSWDLPFILPLLLGATTFVQQKIMPQQMDAAQQKMMTYMMPAIFTAMMLFLPSGLGVYMFTNSVLGIVQQLAVQRYYASQGPGGGGIGVREVESKEKKTDGALAALGKGNARV